MYYAVATNDNKEIIRDFETQQIHYFETKEQAETYVNMCNPYSEVGFKVIESMNKFNDKMYQRQLKKKSRA